MLRLELKNPPEARYGHTATQINEKMYVFGGKNQIQCFNDIWVLNFHSQNWEQQQCQGSPPQERYGHTANLSKLKVYLQSNLKYASLAVEPCEERAWGTSSCLISSTISGLRQ